MSQKKLNLRHISHNRRKVKLTPKILIKEPHIQSRAAAELLKSQLMEQSVPPYVEWLRFREGWMNNIIQNIGTLTCQYCGKENLDKDASEMSSHLATVDHFIPVSLGGKKFDTSNFILACSPCNRKKSNKIISQETIKYGIY